MPASPIAQYAHAITTHFPDLEIASLTLLGEGWANRLYLVNHSWVFRFPKHADGERQLLREIRLLPVLAPHLPVRIPHYTYIAPASDTYPYTFVGYSFIPGVPLHTVIFSVQDAMWWRKSIGAFLTAMHEISSEQVLKAGVSGYATAEAWRNGLVAAHERFRTHVFPLLTPSQCESIAHELEVFLQNDRLFDFTPVVQHQDFGFHNILVDVTTQRVTGVIDFGSCTVGDPALDVPDEVVPYYGRPLDPGWGERRQYYRRTGALQDLAYLVASGQTDVERRIEQKLQVIAGIWPP